MKSIIKYPSNLYIALAMCATIFFGCRCSPSRPAAVSDPLMGFYYSDLENLHTNSAIMSDYQDYVKKLELKKGEFVNSVDFYENKAGQHAVDIKIGTNGKWRDDVIIYSNDNKRLKVIISHNGGYES